MQACGSPAREAAAVDSGVARPANAGARFIGAGPLGVKHILAKLSNAARLRRALLRALRDLGIALVATVLLCEGIVRLGGLDPGEEMVMVDITPEPDPGGTFWPMPARYDPAGDRVRKEGLTTSPDGATQVVVLGDSILFGVHLPARARAAAMLSSRWAITDLAAPGYSTVQMRIALRRHLEDKDRGKPEIVVFSLFHNDSADWQQAGSGVRRGCLRFRVPVPGLGHARLDPATAWWIYRYSAVFRATCRPWIYTERRCQEAAELRMVSEARAIEAMAREAGAKVVLVILPDTRGTWDDVTRARPSMHWYDVIGGDLRRKGAVVIEAQEALSKRPLSEIALDDTGHLNEAGQRLLAEAIEEGLRKASAR